MDLDNSVVVVQLGIIGFIFMLGFKDVNLRYLAVLLFLGLLCYAPFGYVLTETLTPSYGFVFYLYYALVNYLNYKLISLRGCYSNVLAKRMHFLLGGTWGNWIFPLKYEVRRYAQEFKLARVCKYWSWFNLFILLQYPVSAWLKEPEGNVAVFFEGVYLSLFGDNKYFIWELYTPAFRIMALVSMFILISLSVQSVLGLFTKNKLFA